MGPFDQVALVFGRVVLAVLILGALGGLVAYLSDGIRWLARRARR